MRPVTLIGNPGGNPAQTLDWVVRAVRDLETASRENDLVTIAQNFTTDGDLVELRTFDVTSATLDDLRRVFATFLTDLKKGGAKRSV